MSFFRRARGAMSGWATSTESFRDLPCSTTAESPHAVLPIARIPTSNTPPLTKRWTISLFFCFMVPAIVVAGVFFSISWLSLHRAAVDSVDDVSVRLHRVTELHLRQTVHDFLHRMIMATDVIAATVQWNNPPSTLLQSLPNVVASSPEMLSITFARPNGFALSARHENDGSFSAGLRPADCGAVARCSNITFWPVGNDGRVAVDGPPLVSSVFDARSKSWYRLVEGSNASTFTPPPAWSSRGAVMGISYSVPIFTSDGSLDGVLSVNFLFNTLVASLQSTYNASQTSGVLLLMNSDGVVLSCSSPTLPKLADRNILISLPIPQEPFSTIPATFSAYGASYVLQLSFVGLWDFDLDSTGISWRIFVIIPKDDYFAALDRQFRYEIALISGSGVCFSVVMAIFFRVLLTVPLRRLLRQLELLKGLLQFSVQELDIPTDFSRFSELSALHKGVYDVVRVAEETAKERAKELVRVKETEEANEHMTQLIRAKEMFLAMMSHEMRTPLNACIGMAEILLATHLSKDQRECAEAILSSGSLMLTLVNDILDFSKLEAERLVLEKIPFSIRDVVEKVVQAMEIKAEEKHLELIANISADIPLECVGDPSRLSQVLLNLLSNAVKFTSSGSVTVSCSVLREVDMIDFIVQDTGIGMCPEAIGRIFQPFVQADATIARQFGGTGLGLVISRRIIAMMGGNLEVHSLGAGMGCTFTFSLKFDLRHPESKSSHSHRSLPMKDAVSNRSESGISPPLGAAASAFSPHAVPYSASHMSHMTHMSGMNNYPASPTSQNPLRRPALIIDGVDSRRAATCELFRALRMEVYPFASLKNLREIDPNDPAAASRVIVLHAQEFSADAKTILAQVREIHPPQSEHWRIIFITNIKNMPSAFATTHEIVYLAKPVTLKKIREAVEILMDLREVSCAPGEGFQPLCDFSLAMDSAGAVSVGAEGVGALSTGAPQTELAPPLLTINPTKMLIVDDVPLNQRVLTLKLQQRGFSNIDCANSGEAALRMIAESPFAYDVIFMDVMMPDMDGYETTRRIKALPLYKTVPILGVTGHCSAESFKLCVESGMATAIAKPLDTNKLFDALQKFAGIVATLPSAEAKEKDHV